MAASTSPAWARLGSGGEEHAEDHVDHGEAGGADEQQEAAAEAVDGREREHGEDTPTAPVKTMLKRMPEIW